MIASASYSQQRIRKIFVLPTAASTFGERVNIGDFMFLTADSTLYQSKVALGPNATGAYLLASRARYTVGNTTWVGGAVAATTITASSTLGVTGATTLSSLTSTGTANMSGALNVGTSNNKFTVAAATGNTTIAGTLGVTGVATVQGQTMTADHINNLKFGNSITATDTAFAPIFNATGHIVLKSQTLTQNHVNNVLFNNSITATDTVFAPTLSVSGNASLGGTITGNALIRDSVAFSTTDTRVAKAISGGTANSYYIVTPKAKASSGASGRPVAGDLVNVYPKADSVVFMRQAGTTSGLVVYFLRFK